MRKRRLSLPDQKNFEYSYSLAYEMAREQLGRLDVVRQCQNSGASCRQTGDRLVVSLTYLGREYRITLPEVEVALADGPAEVPLGDRILLLHYLTLAQGTPLSGRTISFKELPDAGNYYPTFTKRAIAPLLGRFGGEPGQLVATAERLGGVRADYGVAAVTFSAFPRVPVTLVLWPGDEEFPPQGSILFDSSISDYLQTYDIIVLCETLTWRLVKSA